MNKLNIDALAAQYTATTLPPPKPDLEDRGDGQATLASLEDVQAWAFVRWPNAAKLRDDGATLRAMQEVATGIDAYRMGDVMLTTDPPIRGPNVTRATQAAAWLLSRGEER